MRKFHWVVTDDPFMAASYATDKGAAVKISTTGIRTYRDNNQILVSKHREEDQNNIIRVFTSHFGRRRGEEVEQYLERIDAELQIAGTEGDVYFITCVTPFIYGVLKEGWQFRYKDMDVPMQNWVAELESQLLGSNTIHKAATVALVGEGDVAGLSVRMIKKPNNPNSVHRATGIKSPPCPYRTPEPSSKRPSKEPEKAQHFPKRGADYSFPTSGKFVPNYKDTSLEEATQVKVKKDAITAEQRQRWSDQLGSRFPTK